MAADLFETTSRRGFARTFLCATKPSVEERELGDKRWSLERQLKVTSHNNKIKRLQLYLAILKTKKQYVALRNARLDT